jgi:hypothetical protein
MRYEGSAALIAPQAGTCSGRFYFNGKMALQFNFESA